MHRITHIEPVSESTVHVQFADGGTADICFAEVAARGGVFLPLRDADFFRLVRIGPEGRSLEWPGDLDFCADALRFDADQSASENANRPKRAVTADVR